MFPSHALGCDTPSRSLTVGATVCHVYGTFHHGSPYAGAVEYERNVYVVLVRRSR